MSNFVFTSIEAWEYRDTSAPPPAAILPKAVEAPVPAAVPGFTEEQVALRVQQALAEAEQRLAAQAQAQQQQRDRQIITALEGFTTQRATYFRQLETEVVQLALAVAKKILQREAALDPTMLAGLVRIALDRMSAGPAVRLRLAPGDAAVWQQQPAFADARYTCEVIADPTLAAGACLVETELGSADFGFEAQLKEIEQSFFDLLARRPDAPKIAQ